MVLTEETRMNLGLCGKGVIVTGASNGIGRAVALAFAEEEANVAICARGKEALEKTAAELRAIGLLVPDEDEAWQASLTVDMMGTARASRKVIPWMAEQGGGSIVHISSLA